MAEPSPSQPSTPSGPLIAPVPPEKAGTETSGFLPSFDGHELYYKRRSPPSSTPVSSVVGLVWVHGYNEYIDRYEQMFPIFSARGIEMIAYDQRGFGQTALSVKNGGWKKNYTNTSWPQQFKDAKAVAVDQRKFLDEKYGQGKVKMFMLGHSMGGGIVTALFTRDPQSEQGADLEVLKGMVSGVICSSPWYDLAMPLPTFMHYVGPALLRWFPNIKYPAPLTVTDLTRDPEIQARYKKDPLIKTWVMLKSAEGPLYGGPKIVSDDYKNWPKLLPIHIIHGDQDRVTSAKASRSFIDKVTNEVGCKEATWTSWKDGLHEILFEVGETKSLYANALCDWILSKGLQQPSRQAIPPPPETSTSTSTSMATSQQQGGKEKQEANTEAETSGNATPRENKL